MTLFDSYIMLNILNVKGIKRFYGGKMILREGGKMGLKIPRSQGHLGSIPSSGTNPFQRFMILNVLIFFRNHPFSPFSE